MGKAKIIENTYLKVYKKLTILYCQFQYQNWPEKIKQTMREIQKLEKCYSGEKKKALEKKKVGKGESFSGGFIQVVKKQLLVLLLENTRWQVCKLF